LIYSSKINNTTGQQILETMFKTGESPTEIMTKGNLGQIDNSADLEKIIDKIVSANPKAVEDYKAGKETSFKFLVGMAMRETKGQANPAVINKLLEDKLK
jgi:aspartyl-tRNA(Asn)/glutamyl-tRNA(Gln) amidotransferase subunit B